MRADKIFILVLIILGLAVMVHPGIAGLTPEQTKKLEETPSGRPKILTPTGYIFELVTISGKEIPEPQKSLKNIMCPGWGGAGIPRTCWIFEFKDGSTIYTLNP